MMQGDDLLEITEVRRLFEPVATGLAPPVASRRPSWPRSSGISTLA